MHIVPQDPTRDIKEYDKILRRLLTERAHEWRGRTGVRGLLARLKIEFWAWRQAARELRATQDKPDRNKLY
jgi:hypothetical protein